MIKNLLRIAARNFKKDAWYSILNILGLTIGITFSLFLIFYIRDELSFDRYNKKADRIFRINSYIQERDKNTNWTLTQAPLAMTLKKDYPEVEEATRFMGKERTLFKEGDKNFYENSVYYADSTVFKIFTYPFLQGDPNTALKEPNSIVISKSEAEKYFGKNADVIGKTIKTVYDVYKITGVTKDVPRNSHLRFDMLISWSSLPKNAYGGDDNWGNFNYYTYVLLRPGTNAKTFEKKLVPMYEKYMAPLFAQFHVKMHYGVQNITNIHLHSDLQNEPEEVGSMSYIWIFSAVAFFMMLIACINYMNLTTARSARRAKEIGMRKVMGSNKRQLIFQFLSESVFTALAAVLLSFILVLLLLPAFDSLSGKEFTWRTLFQPFNIFLVIAIGLITGLVGGSYPAFYLSSFKPVSVLKGALSKASGNLNLRKTLVVLQFATSMVMLICTWIVYSQLRYVRNKDVGYNKDQVMTIIVNTGKDERPKIDAMDNDLRNLAGVKNVGTGNSYPSSPNLNLNLFRVQTDSGYVDKAVNCYTIDENFLPVLNIPVIHGRNFENLGDTLHSIIVNQAMVKHFGWKEPLGMRIKFPGDTTGNYMEVVGVVKDFNQKSLYNPIEPLLFFYGPDGNMIQLKMNTSDMKSSIAKIENVWKKYFPGLPFEYKFLDQDFNSQYAADQRRGKIFAAFSILTILITCLGLLGLTAFTTQQKQKEISIRRVLGASVSNIVRLVSVNYLWLALIAACIAFPIAYYFMNKWLQVFPYNAGISAIPFIVSGLIIVLTSILTVMFHSTKAALAKPANNLRTE
ncbi:MAG: ABC transporter permease [Ginsengibacter sp.]